MPGIRFGIAFPWRRPSNWLRENGAGKMMFQEEGRRTDKKPNHRT
jgi:hypothetical protein